MTASTSGCSSKIAAQAMIIANYSSRAHRLTASSPEVRTSELDSNVPFAVAKMAAWRIKDLQSPSTDPASCQIKSQFWDAFFILLFFYVSQATYSIVLGTFWCSGRRVLASGTFQWTEGPPAVLRLFLNVLEFDVDAAGTGQDCFTLWGSWLYRSLFYI